jgi:hypothetical protein
VEVPPARSLGKFVPEVSAPRDWTTFLREQTPPGRAAVCLPFAEGFSVEQLEPTSRWMLYQTQHRVPLLNGYSGYFPPWWFRAAEALVKEPFAQGTLEMLSDAGVEFVVIDTLRHRPPDPAAATAAPLELRLVFRSESGVEIWQLVDVGP